MSGVTILWLVTAYVINIFIAWIITGYIRRYALRHEILDHPNHRSLHSSITPRGGGITIALLYLCSLSWLYFIHHIPLQYFLGIGGGVLFVSLIGWIDDRRGLPAMIRGCAYLTASIWMVVWITGVTALMNLHQIGYVAIAVIGIMWLTNLYNFMDGTDAFAGSQALIAAGAGAFFLLQADSTAQALLMAVVSASTAGFLIWNWPKAKIFMGDTGSCTIGFVFGSTAMISDFTKSVPVTVWLILLSLFISDSTLTLFKRFISREPWYQAHRQHAYQLLVQMGMSHKQLAYAAISVNLLILVPVSFIASKVEAYAWPLTVITYIGITVLWLTIQIKYNTLRKGSRTE